MGKMVSYCRFSSDNWQCDVYCYPASNGAVVTRIASNRIAVPVPPLPSYADGAAAWHAANEQQVEFVADAPRRPLRLPYAGREYIDANAADALARLESLRAAGYRIPQRAFDALRAEIVPLLSCEAAA